MAGKGGSTPVPRNSNDRPSTDSMPVAGPVTSGRNTTSNGTDSRGARSSGVGAVEEKGPVTLAELTRSGAGVSLVNLKRLVEVEPRSTVPKGTTAPALNANSTPPCSTLTVAAATPV